MRVLANLSDVKNMEFPYRPDLKWVRVKDGDELACLTWIEISGCELLFYASFKSQNGQIRHDFIRTVIP